MSTHQHKISFSGDVDDDELFDDSLIHSNSTTRREAHATATPPVDRTGSYSSFARENWNTSQNGRNSTPRHSNMPPPVIYDLEDEFDDVEEIDDPFIEKYRRSKSPLSLSPNPNLPLSTTTFSSNASTVLSSSGHYLDEKLHIPQQGKHTVGFRDSHIPTIPESAYGGPYNGYYGENYPEYINASPRFPREFSRFEMESIPNVDLESGRPLRPYSQHITFSGDDYVINPLEDADDDEDIDPFGDDDSLFSETGEEIIRRGTTIKRGPGHLRKTKNKKDDYLYDEEELFSKHPRLNYTKTIKKTTLIDGNYVIDCPVPESLLDAYGKKITEPSREMSFMRYTAATCGPSNFQAFKYNLRQGLYQPARSTEIMICVTMYNENEILLGKTLKGVFDNIQDLTRRSDPNWGEDSWKKIVVVIVCDGRVNLNKRTEKLLTALGVYQEGYAKSKINDKSVKSHIYEYTSTVGIDAVNDRVHLKSNDSPVQFLFCLKEKNAKKINSHRWCLQAFGPILNPKVVTLLDCGTQPSKDAIYHLWRSFNDKNVAGACGEMRAGLGSGGGLLINPLVAAQNFEYKISNILDKPMESVFGFITVLPGAFSAYRYEALLNVEGQGPLEKYFKGEFLHQDAMIDDEDDDEKKLKEKNFHEAGIFTSNMYLAEDRILCFELVAKRGHNYVLRYVKEAKAETDVPESLDEFVLQRRRWLNGSFFAASYAIFHWTKIWNSRHSLFRKIMLQIEFYYQLITLIVSWLSLGCFFLVFRILTANLGASNMGFNVGKYLSVIFLWLYGGCVVCTFVLAFGNTPRGTKKFYIVVVTIFAVLMAYMMFAAIFLAVRTTKDVLNQNKDDFVVSMLFTNSKFRDLVLSIASTYVLYFFGAFLYGEPAFMFSSFIQYVLLSPSYVNVLNIYAFCNIHDVSWGTKGVATAKDLGAAKSTGGKKDELVTIVPGVAEELNEKYINILEDLRIIPPSVIDINAQKKRDDSYYALVRTITVLTWLLCNFILIIVVLKTGGIDTLTNSTSQNADDMLTGNTGVFLGIILWVVAGLAAFRFFGCIIYLVMRMFRPLKWRFQRKRELKRMAKQNA